MIALLGPVDMILGQWLDSMHCVNTTLWRFPCHFQSAGRWTVMTWYHRLHAVSVSAQSHTITGWCLRSLCLNSIDVAMCTPACILASNGCVYTVYIHCCFCSPMAMAWHMHNLCSISEQRQTVNNVLAQHHNHISNFACTGTPLYGQYHCYPASQKSHRVRSRLQPDFGATSSTRTRSTRSIPFKLKGNNGGNLLNDFIEFCQRWAPHNFSQHMLQSYPRKSVCWIWTQQCCDSIGRPGQTAKDGESASGLGLGWKQYGSGASAWSSDCGEETGKQHSDRGQNYSTLTIAMICKKGFISRVVTDDSARNSSICFCVVSDSTVTALVSTSLPFSSPRRYFNCTPKVWPEKRRSHQWEWVRIKPSDESVEPLQPKGGQPSRSMHTPCWGSVYLRRQGSLRRGSHLCPYHASNMVSYFKSAMQAGGEADAHAGEYGTSKVLQCMPTDIDVRCLATLAPKEVLAVTAPLGCLSVAPYAHQASTGLFKVAHRRWRFLLTPFLPYTPPSCTFNANPLMSTRLHTFDQQILCYAGRW